MPARKEYQMLFSLGATLGSSYNKTFAEAQAKLLQYQKQIEAHNRALSDIKGYNSQTEKLNKYKADLEKTEGKLKDVTDALKTEEGQTSSNEKKKVDLTRKIEDLNKKIEEQAQKCAESAVALQNEGVDTENLVTEKARLIAELEDLRSKQIATAESAEKMGEQGNDAIEAISEAIITTGIIDAMKELYSAFNSCITIATEFGWSMANVKALTGATSDEYEQLTAKAKQLGADTRYTATESADAMGYMAMAGWKTQEMLDGMDGVIMLAAAANEDLATTSSIVTDSLNAFNMKASDTVHFADVLASAATNSNTTVSLMGETFKYAASSAGALGYSVEDVATGIMLMANRGVKGTMAGTSLRLTLSKLAKDCTLTGQAFGEYEYSAVKADGTLKTFQETLEELRGVFSRMTAQEKVANAQNIAGVRSYNGLLAMLNATSDEYDRVRASIDNCAGSAEKMASVKMDSIQGDLYLMTSATDALKTSFGELWEEETRGLYKAGKEFANYANNFVLQNKGLIKALTIGIATFGTFATTIVAVSTAIKVLNATMTILKTVGLVGTFASLASGVAIFSAITGAVVVATEAFKNHYDEVRNVSEHILPEFQAQESELESLTSQYQAYVEAGNESSEAARQLKVRITELNTSLGDNKTTIGTLQTDVKNLATRYKELKDAYNDSVGQQEESSEQGQDYADVLDTLDRKTNKTKTDIELMGSIVDKLNGQYEGLGLTVDATTGKLNKSTTSVRGFINQADNSAMKDIKNDFITSNLTNYDKAKSDMDTAYKNASIAYDKYKEAEAEWIKTHPVLSKLAKGAEMNWDDNLGALWSEWNNLRETANEASDVYRGLQKDIQTAYTEMGNDEQATADFMEGLDEKGAEVADAVKLRGEEFASGTSVILDSVIPSITALSKAYDDAYEAAYKSVYGQYDLWDKLDEKTQETTTSATDMIDAMSSQKEYWESYNQNLEKLRELANSDEYTGLSTVIANFVDGSAESVAAIKGMAEADPSQLKEMIETFSELQEQQSLVTQNVSEMSIEYDQQVKDLADGVEESVEQLGTLPEKARQYGEDTISAFIENANAQTDAVYRAYKSVADAATRGLNSVTLNPVQVSTPTGYASGTDNATAGVHLVGEDGPELVYFNGGEKVLNAHDTLQAMESNPLAGNTNNVQVSFNIEGNADTNTVAMFQQFADSFAEKVLEVISDAGIDGARRAYA